MKWKFFFISERNISLNEKNWELIGLSLLINAFSCESQGEEGLVSRLAHVIREEMSLHRGQGIHFD